MSDIRLGVVFPAAADPGRFEVTFGHGVAEWMEQIGALTRKRLLESSLRRVLVAQHRRELRPCGRAAAALDRRVARGQPVPAPAPARRCAGPTTTAETCADAVRRFAAAGADTLVLVAASDQRDAQVEAFAETVMPLLVGRAAE
jgi:hypothetical protein